MEKLGDKKKYHKKIIVFIFIIAMLFTLISYALSDVNVEYLKENGEQYIFFKLNHNIANVAYKYFGYGYHVTIYDNYGSEIGYKFLTNAEFEPKMIGGVETVKIPIKKLYDKTNVETKYYYRQDCTIWLNGRLGIKVNGTLKFLYDSLEGTPEKGLDSLPKGYATYDGQTVPLNKDSYGIKNGINHEYNISWSQATQDNLEQHFGIHFTLDPIVKYDGYEVLYKEVATGKTISSQKPIQNFNQAKTITEYPQSVNGYEYSGYYEIRKLDKIGNTTNLKPIIQGDSATVSLAQTSSVYTIIFYYNKVDPSSIGKPVYIDIEYRENTSDGKILNKSTTILGGELSQVNINSVKIDGYIAKGHFRIGQAIEYFYNTIANFLIGKEDYSKPVDGRLKIIFIYEKVIPIEIPKCDPVVSGNAETVYIEMKKNDFINATEISINNAIFEIESFQSGKDGNGNTVDGTHQFKFFDLYIGNYSSSYDNLSKKITQSFIVPKNIFVQSATDPNFYTTSVDVIYAAFCTCFDGKPDNDGDYGWETDRGNININITLLENKPPVAKFEYYTEKNLEDGSKSEISKAFKGYETIINNQASDPNGLFDINYIKYTLKDSKGNEYFAKLLLLQDGSYMLEEDNIQANNIEMLGASENGNIKVKFKDNETWVVSQYVQDLEGLNDTYTTSIVVEELNLKPIAILKDNPLYRFPLGVELNGKQNRVVMFNSNNSHVANFLSGTSVSINHNRDTWEIVPLDGQSFDGIKFEKDINSQIIDGVLQVKYLPLNNIKMMFKEPGRYNFRLQVTDTNGNVSDFTDNIITINEDIAPIVSANLNSIFYRAENGIATIKFNILPQSLDYDSIEIKSIGYKFDSNNNNFDDETLSTANLSYKDINIDGLLYKEITLSTDKLGKYQFVINVVERFNQESMLQYITEDDYKKAYLVKSTEVDNKAPVGTLGLTKDNNIDVKIMTSGLTGTKPTDVANNISNLKIWLESKYNIKVGNIETINLANEVNGLLTENALAWRKVTFNTGNKYNDDLSFLYKEIDGVTDLGGNSNTNPELPLAGYWYNMLPTGTYAEGWNGIPVPNLYIGQNIGGINIETDIKYKHIFQTMNNKFLAVKRDMFLLQYNNTSVKLGNLYSGNNRWGNLYADASMISAITEKKIKDFDISFSLNVSAWDWADLNSGEVVGKTMFMFNVKDKNNYFAYVQAYAKQTTHSDPIGEIVQIKNGVPKVLKTFYYERVKDEGEWTYEYTNITRIKQVGNNIKAYSGDRLLFEYQTSNSDVGGYFGLSHYNGYCADDIALNIIQLTYIEDSSMYTAIEQLQWRNDTDKYIINIVEGTKLEELNNTYAFNRTLGKLQEKNICLINLGVNTVNGTKLKSLVTKNSNNGTFIEISNLYDNLKSASEYISKKYNGVNEVSQYLLLGENINNIENYYDFESDVKLLSEFRYNHIFNYFDNNLGVISNNNIWISKPINTFNKTGKYTLNYRVKDNPLYPDTNEYNNFNNYRKYSELLSKDIYVHRKPISSFVLGTVGTNAWTNVSLSEDFQDGTYVIQPTGGYWSSSRETWYIANNVTATVDFTVPDNAIDIKLSFRADRTNTGYATINISNIGISIPSWYGGSSLDYYLKTGNTRLTVKASSNANILLDNIVLTYSIPNETVSIPITDYSYDTDHTSRTDKGLTEWQWRIIDKTGNISTQTFTNKDTGISWVRSNLQTNGKWVDCSVQLRVKDMENTWSDWSGKFIDGKSSLDGGDTSGTITKPIVDFLIDKNPLRLKSEIQILTDISYDKDGYTLSNIWNVYKDGKFLFMNTLKDINSQLNKAINENGVGVYEIRLQVINSKNVYSDIVAKDFEVIVYNEKPLVDFNLVSNQNPTWVFPKALGLYTLKYRPSNTLFYEEYARFDTYAHDPNNDNLGFIYNWKLERFAVKNTSDISGMATNIYNYTSQFPFVNSFKNQGLNWGAYKITFKVTDIPPTPPYKSTDSKSAEITKYYYIVPEISLNGSFESSKADIMVGDTIKLKSTTTKLVDSVNCTLAGTTYDLSKSSEDGSFIYWEKEIVIPESITESGTYNLSFIGKTTYGGNGNVTREVKDNVPIDIIALKLINFRIKNIVNHTDITFPYTKDMLLSNLIPYKTGYNVTFQIDSKGEPDNVYGRIDVGNNGTIDQNINLTKVVTGDMETWQGKFYTLALLPSNTVISIKLDCNKGTTTYNYNEKENWDGRSLVIKGSALQDGRINLTN